MRLVSTRAGAEPARFSEAILRGLAPDGGLYVPERFPRVSAATLAALRTRLDRFDAFAALLLRPFFARDPLADDLQAICSEAFDFPVTLAAVSGSPTAVLELYHGPTAAFKDVGARFLAGCLDRTGSATPDTAPRTVLVATSGDTGAAVAAAFHGRPHLEVGVLFPSGGVSLRQERQLTCWDGNVRSFAVRGAFDDCQRMVKAAFAHPPRSGDEPGSATAARLTTANSINIGRLLPQVVYYAWSALVYQERTGEAPGVVVPSGNVGNAVAALWARQLGFPVRHVVLATNANRVVPDWFDTGEWRPRPSVRTLANAMDVGDPSNMERVFALYAGRDDLRDHASAASVDDPSIRDAIVRAEERWGRVLCPHTATAAHVRERLGSPHWIVVATAHPSKFPEVVEPLIGRVVPVPPRLRALLDRPTRVREIDAGADVLAELAGERA